MYKIINIKINVMKKIQEIIFMIMTDIINCHTLKINMKCIIH